MLSLYGQLEIAVVDYVALLDLPNTRLPSLQVKGVKLNAVEGLGYLSKMTVRRKALIRLNSQNLERRTNNL